MAIKEETLTVIEQVAGNILGKKALGVIKRKVSERGVKEPMQVIIAMAEEAEELFGKGGSFAVMRQMGREVAKLLMQNSQKEEWQKLLEEGLRVMGFAEGIRYEDGKYCICNCVFYPSYLHPKGYEPPQHCICWAGIGYIEGFVRQLYGVKGINFEGREDSKCIFSLIE